MLLWACLWLVSELCLGSEALLPEDAGYGPGVVHLGGMDGERESELAAAVAHWQEDAVGVLGTSRLGRRSREPGVK